MRILFDLISLQDNFINGGAEYTLKVFTELIVDKQCELLGLLDKKKIIPKFLQDIISFNNINCFFIQDSIEKIALEQKIDKFYIGIAQRYNSIDLTKLSCKVLVTCHDVGDLCNEYDNKIDSNRLRFVHKYSKNSITRKIKNLLSLLYHHFMPYKVRKFYANFEKLISQQNVYVITDSAYSKGAICYFFDDIYNNVEYFYAPLKQMKNIADCQIQNELLKTIVSSQKKYFLLLNCERYNKNAALFAEIWNKFYQKNHYDYYVIMIGKLKYTGKNIFQIDSLSVTDLEFAYKNAYALVYPSVSEGFGYPPIEAMKYGTPVLCSNVTSIPEVCGNKVLYFSPYYPEDLFMAMTKICQNRDLYSKLALEQYSWISKKQEQDFTKLIKYIIGV